MTTQTELKDSYNGKRAKRIYYGRDGECLQEAKEDMAKNYKKEIIFQSEFHGEYDLGWFIVLENGIEKSRHSAKFIETIEWEN